jgi:hypothetical protein
MSAIAAVWPASHRNPSAAACRVVAARIAARQRGKAEGTAKLYADEGHHQFGVLVAQAGGAALRRGCVGPGGSRAGTASLECKRWSPFVLAVKCHAAVCLHTRAL